jgi:hypothetical protein
MKTGEKNWVTYYKKARQPGAIIIDYESLDKNDFRLNSKDLFR